MYALTDEDRAALAAAGLEARVVGYQVGHSVVDLRWAATGRLAGHWVAHTGFGRADGWGADRFPTLLALVARVAAAAARVGPVTGCSAAPPDLKGHPGLRPAGRG